MDYLTIDLLNFSDAALWLALLIAGSVFTALAFYGKYPPQYICVYWVLLFIQFAFWTLMCFESGGIFYLISAVSNALLLLAGVVSRIISPGKSNDHDHNGTTH